MIKSMTGYGHAQYCDDEVFIEAEVKSINSKYLDLSINVPQEFNSYGNELNKMVSNYLIRGKVMITIKQQCVQGKSQYTIDEEAFADALSLLRHLSRDLDCHDDNLFNLAMKIPGVISQKSIKTNANKRIGVIKDILQEALEKCDYTRSMEGTVLAKKIAQYIYNVRQNTEEIQLLDKDRVDEVRKKLKERIEQLRPGIGLDESRLEQEVVYYAQKISIEEEKERALCHIEQFKESLATGGAISKKLLFIVQEINREITTTASKANNYPIQKLTIAIKDELEKIKEQIQNIL
jgi:uncharacterized protein (TIGR00255 family)